MKIGLISDTHGSAKSFEKVMRGPFSQVGLILHAGDVLQQGLAGFLSGRLNQPTLADLINGLGVPILVARGNCDSETDQTALNVPLMSPYVFAYVEGRRLMVVHGNGLREDDLEQRVKRFGLDVLIHGHSHIARVKKVGPAVIVNPGTPTNPNPAGRFNKTVGIFDTDSGTIRVEDIDTGIIVLEEVLGL